MPQKKIKVGDSVQTAHGEEYAVACLAVQKMDNGKGNPKHYLVAIVEEGDHTYAIPLGLKTGFPRDGVFTYNSEAHYSIERLNEQLTTNPTRGRVSAYQHSVTGRQGVESIHPSCLEEKVVELNHARH